MGFSDLTGNSRESHLGIQHYHAKAFSWLSRLSDQEGLLPVGLLGWE